MNHNFHSNVEAPVRQMIAFVGTLMTGAWLFLQTASVNLLPIIGTIGGAAIAGFVTYKIAVRTSSGRIRTTEAADIWAAAESIRKELRDEVASLRSQVRDLEDRLRLQVRESDQREADLERRIRELEAA